MTTNPTSGVRTASDEQRTLPPEEVSRRLRLALDVSKIGVFDADLETGWVSRDATLMDIYGYANSPNSEEGTFFEAAVHPDDRAAAMETIAAGIASGEPFTNAFRIVRPDGTLRHIRSRSVTFRDGDGHRRLLGANWDVTDDVTLHLNLETARKEIEQRSLHDQLTSLPNRRHLLQRIAETASPESHYAILHIDLARFQEINDTLGHAAGDAALVHVARRLEAFCGPDDFLARIGGDEFALVCRHAGTSDGLADLAERILAALGLPIPCEGHLCRCGASIGIALSFDSPGCGHQTLINAAIALSTAKAMGGNACVVFTPALENARRQVKQTADDILAGLETGEFCPFYQPQFDARTLDICGLETLARWHHPRKGVLTPDVFLKIAEDIDVMWRIDREIAARARAEFAGLRAGGFIIPHLSVNVSTRRLLDPNLLEGFSDPGIPSGTFIFELLESIFLDAPDMATAEAIETIRAAGIGIDIDDFGTGHASILSLLTLRPTRLKIDGALVAPIAEGEDKRKLVAAIIDMGHALNIEVLAEGVETSEQIRILRDLGCDALQGYALARPMNGRDLEAFIKAGSWRDNV